MKTGQIPKTKKLKIFYDNNRGYKLSELLYHGRLMEAAAYQRGLKAAEVRIVKQTFGPEPRICAFCAKEVGL